MSKLKISPLLHFFILVVLPLAFLFVTLFIFTPPAVAACSAATCTGQSGCMCNGTTCQTQGKQCSNSTVVCGGAANVPCCVNEWAAGHSCSQSSCNGGAGCGGGGGGGGGGNTQTSTPTPTTNPNYDLCYSAGSDCFVGTVDLNGKNCCAPDVCVPQGTNTQTGKCQAPNTSYLSTCLGGTCDTAIGEISLDPKQFISTIFSVLLTLASAIAVVLIIVSGYRLMISQGNPEQIQGAKDQLTAAIVGLLFLALSFSILRFIGVDVLKIFP